MFRIKEVREKIGITQEQLAEKVNVSKEFISYIENGHKDPSISLLKKIARVLNTTMKDLIAENEHLKT